MAASQSDETRVNDRIRAREVRLIDPDGQQLGIKALPEAQSIARSMELDLVEVAPDANPPVCRIMNFTKFKYEEQQRAKESRKKATNIVVKEMKYRPKIGGGDFDTKTRKVAQFLGEGHKVKITIMFRGREMQHPELGRRILDRVAAEVAEVGKVEIMPKQDGRNMTMVLGPDKVAQALATAQAKKADDVERSAAETEPAEAEPTPTPTDSASPFAKVQPSTSESPSAEPESTEPESTETETVEPESVETESTESDTTTTEPEPEDIGTEPAPVGDAT